MDRPKNLKIGMVGIYKIVNKINGKCYVGSSVNLYGRYRMHKSTLNRDTHHSLPLRRAWKKYGKDAFNFVIIELCNKDELLKIEQEYLDKISPEYNMSKFVSKSLLGYRWSKEEKEIIWAKKLKTLRKNHPNQEMFSWLNSKKPESSKENYSKAVKERWKNPAYKAKMKKKFKQIRSTDEYKETQRNHMKRRKLWKLGQEHPNAKLTNEDIIEIRASYIPRKITMGFLAKKYNVSKSLIGKVINRQAWKHLK